MVEDLIVVSQRDTCHAFSDGEYLRVLGRINLPDEDVLATTGNSLACRPLGHELCYASRLDESTALGGVRLDSVDDIVFFNLVHGEHSAFGRGASYRVVSL